jgi:zinc and cadmium transporter
LLFSLPDRVLALYLAFFCGFLLYLATSDILPEAHSRHPSRLTLLCTVVGVAFIAFVVAIA